jgi:hypothetical protein
MIASRLGFPNIVMAGPLSRPSMNSTLESKHHTQFVPTHFFLLVIVWTAIDAS